MGRLRPCLANEPEESPRASIPSMPAHTKNKAIQPTPKPSAKGLGQTRPKVDLSNTKRPGSGQGSVNKTSRTVPVATSVGTKITSALSAGKKPESRSKVETGKGVAKKSVKAPSPPSAHQARGTGFAKAPAAATKLAQRAPVKAASKAVSQPAAKAASARVTSTTQARSVAKAPVKAPIKVVSKSSPKPVAKAPAKSAAPAASKKPAAKAPAKAPTKAPVKSPAKPAPKAVLKGSGKATASVLPKAKAPAKASSKVSKAPAKPTPRPPPARREVVASLQEKERLLKEKEKERLLKEKEKERADKARAQELLRIEAERTRLKADKEAEREAARLAKEDEKRLDAERKEEERLAREEEKLRQKAQRDAEREDARRQRDEERARREAEREAYRKVKEAERERLHAQKEAQKRALEGRIAEANRIANKLGGARSTSNRIYSPRAIPNQSGTRRPQREVDHIAAVANAPQPLPSTEQVEELVLAPALAQPDDSRPPSPPERPVPTLENIEERYRSIEERLGKAADDFRRDYRETLDMSWIYHDSALEGVVYTFQELKSATDPHTSVISDSSMQPVVEEIRRHKAAIELVRELGEKRRAPITLDVFKRIYLTLHPDAGDLKTIKYRRDIPQHRLYFHEYAHPEKIQPKLRQIIDWLNGPEPKKMKSPLRVAARAHYELLRVFPFQVDSGKASRLFMNLLLLRAGHPPAIIHSTERQRYYEALKGSLPVIVQMVSESLLNGLVSIEKLLDEHEARPR